MKRPECATRRSVNDTCTRVAIEHIEVQVITTDFLAESDEQEPPKYQADRDFHTRIPNLSQFDGLSFPLCITTTVTTKVPIDTKTGDERVF